MKIQSLPSFFIVLCMLFSCGNQEKSEESFELEISLKMNEATNYYQKGEYNKSISVLENLTKYHQLTKYKRERTSIYYDLACNHALIGNKNEALTYLEKAVDSGFAAVSHIERDDDLQLIRNEERFKRLVYQLKREQKLWDNPFINTHFRNNISEHEKIAGLSKLWSEIKYNFINFDLIPDINLDSLYLVYLTKVRETASTLDYYKVLQEFCVHLKDGHTKVNFPEELRSQINGRVPIQTRLVEDRIIITKVFDKGLVKKGIDPGVEITYVDGYEAKTYADKFIRPYWTSNSKHGRNRTIFEYAFLRGPVGKQVILTCKDARGKIFNITLTRLKRIPGKWEPVIYRQLEDNIGYLNIKSFYADEIVNTVDSVFSQIMNTDALIIDLRENGGGNGRVGWTILGYFFDKPFRIFNWKSRVYRPFWRAWGQREEIYEKDNTIKFADAKKYYAGQVVLLTRARTASMAENFCVGFNIMNRGKTIGGPTMGSSGTPLFFSLPGGGSGQVVTTRSFFPDGTDFIGTGVQPDIEVYPTIDDFRSGVDRVLDKAVEYLNNNIKLCVGK
jgi:carboxyl-terminal processing protease